MSPAALELHQAEKAVENARCRVAAEQRERDIQTLAALRSDLREAKARYEKIAAEHVETTEARALLTRQIDEVHFLIAENQRRRPSIADILPEDPEVVAWRAQHTKLQAEQEGYVAQRSAIPLADRVEGLKLATSIQQLQWSIQNILNKLGDDTGTYFDGGVSFVA